MVIIQCIVNGFAIPAEAEGADPHDTMVNVLTACKKVEDDCEIFDI